MASIEASKHRTSVHLSRDYPYHPIHTARCARARKSKNHANDPRVPYTARMFTDPLGPSGRKVDAKCHFPMRKTSPHRRPA
jgi:hypothetical protein